MPPFGLLHFRRVDCCQLGFQGRELCLGEDSKSDLFSLVDQGDKNNALMSQEVVTLQEMLNSLDFKRKVSEEL